MKIPCGPQNTQVGRSNIETDPEFQRCTDPDVDYFADQFYSMIDSAFRTGIYDSIMNPCIETGPDVPTDREVTECVTKRLIRVPWRHKAKVTQPDLE